MAKPKMLILRGTSGDNLDESGNTHNYTRGALHEKAAMDYADCVGFDGEVLDVSGDPGKDGDRDNNPQTLQAVAKLKDKNYRGLYGFSGGGYDVRHILDQLDMEDLEHIDRVVVLGAPPVKNGVPSEADFKSDRYAKKFADRLKKTGGKIEWKLVYMTNPPNTFKTPNNVDRHMFGPEFLLIREKCTKSSP